MSSFSHRFGTDVAVGTLLLVCALGNPGCSASPVAPDPSGSWGGVGIHLVVTSAGTDLELDCAHAALGPLTTESDGSFTESADLVMEGGPEREGVPRETRGVVVDGSIAGDHMTVSIRFDDDGFVAGPYDLRRGEQGLLRKCL